MRRAFVPTSLLPTRETLRTSTRLPCPSGRMRTTTSSLKPNHPVVAVASTRPAAESAATMAQPAWRAASRARANAAPGEMAGRTSERMSG